MLRTAVFAIVVFAFCIDNAYSQKVIVEKNPAPQTGDNTVILADDKPGWVSIVLDEKFSDKGKVWDTAQEHSRLAKSFGLRTKNPDDIVSINSGIDKAGLTIDEFKKKYGEGKVIKSEVGSDAGMTYYVHGPIGFGFKLGDKQFSKLRAPARMFDDGFVEAAKKVKEPSSKSGISSKDSAPATKADITTPAPKQIQEAKMIAHLEQRGGVRLKTKTVGGNAPDPSDQQTHLERPVDVSSIEKLFGKPERIDKDAIYFDPNFVAGQLKPTVKGESWRYGRLALFVKNGTVLQFEEWKAAANPDTFPKAPAKWPAFQGQLSGGMEVRIRNPNPSAVRVGLRSNGQGNDFIVPGEATKSASVPNGPYEIYFQFADKPDKVFQGDKFALKDNGVEIQIVKVVNGNYSIHEVE